MDKTPFVWTPRRPFPACSGPSCNQGRAECKTKQACRIAEPDDQPEFGLPFPGLQTKTPPNEDEDGMGPARGILFAAKLAVMFWAAVWAAYYLLRAFGGA